MYEDNPSKCSKDILEEVRLGMYFRGTSLLSVSAVGSISKLVPDLTSSNIFTAIVVDQATIILSGLHKQPPTLFLCLLSEPPTSHN